MKTLTPEEYYDKAILGSEAGCVIEENDLKMTVLKILDNYASLVSEQEKRKALKDLEKIKSMCDGNITNENNIWHVANNAIESLQ